MIQKIKIKLQNKESTIIKNKKLTKLMSNNTSKIKEFIIMKIFNFNFVE